MRGTIYGLIFLYLAGKAYVIKAFNAGLTERSGSVANY